MLNRQSKILFTVLLVVSLLLHGLAWWWLDIKELFQPELVDESTTVQITLQLPPEPTPKPEPLVQQLPPQPETRMEPPEPEPQQQKPEPEQHMPMHNADEFASSNNTDRSKTKLAPGEKINSVGTEVKPSSGQLNEIKSPTQPEQQVKEQRPQDNSSLAKENSKKTNTKNEVNPKDSEEQKSAQKTDEPDKPKKVDEIISTNSHSRTVGAELVSRKVEDKAVIERQREQHASNGSLTTESNLSRPPAKTVEIPKEALASLGNMKMLDDHNLNDVEVEEPFSEIEAKRIRMVNRYLARMEAQIKSQWIRPDKKQQRVSGVIKFSLNVDGFLDEAYIYIASGDLQLDISALDAVRRVQRYAVPESKAVTAKYYRNLRFQYSSHEIESEAIPGLP